MTPFTAANVASTSNAFAKEATVHLIANTAASLPAGIEVTCLAAPASTTGNRIIAAIAVRASGLTPAPSDSTGTAASAVLVNLSWVVPGDVQPIDVAAELAAILRAELAGSVA